jgi:hypothetical protein
MLKTFITTIVLVWATAISAQTIPPDVFDPLIDEEIPGELMYLDYSSNKEVRIPVNLLVTRIKEGTYQFAYSYPDEPKANSKARVRITADGKKLGGDKITKAAESEGVWHITTEYKGDDNNEKAMIRITWTVGPKTFTTKKEVRYKDQADYFTRNQYSFSQ